MTQKRKMWRGAGRVSAARMNQILGIAMVESAKFPAQPVGFIVQSVVRRINRRRQTLA